LEGFILFSSLGGGTGSGLGKAVLEKLMNNYPKKMKVAEHIIPSHKLSTSVVEVYNFCLSTSSFIEFEDFNIMMDNEALYSIATNKLDIEKPSYRNLNALVS
jgi:tubulin alpha